MTPDTLYSTTLYDFNRMAAAYTENRKDNIRLLRTHAYLVSIYSGLDQKGRKKLKPEKMWPLNEQHEIPDEEEIQEWLDFFNRPVIATKTYN